MGHHTKSNSRVWSNTKVGIVKKWYPSSEFDLPYWDGGGCFTLHFCFLSLSKIVATTKSKFWHAYEAIKMPSDQRSNEDINAQLDFKIRKKLFLVPITTKSGSIHLRQSFDILIEGWWISPTFLRLITPRTLRSRAVRRLKIQFR